MHVVATAGHVDHGKSSLVLALTGTDPDRFAEEKRRGLTIDLGFAHTTLASGAGVSFVDVPGHVRFIKNMLAGVGAVDACLFVVAATEGWKPQSEEHLRILEMLGVRHGIVALTKADLVDDEWLDLARFDVVDHVAGTFLDGAPVVAVAATTGLHLDDLRAALDELLAATPTATDRARPRLWVDRSFVARGAGTVVTGTLAGGAMAVGDQLVVGPGELPVRVRGIQSHGASHERIGPGNRVALNLNGVEHEQVERGDAVYQPARWRPTQRFDARLHVLDSIGHNVSRRGAYVAYIGSGEHPIRLRVLGEASIRPGEDGLVRLHLVTPLPLLPGDRFVLRESGRSETVGGGEVLDVAPIRPASKARPDRDVERVVAERGWVTVDELDALTGERRMATVGRWVVAPGVVEAMRMSLVERVTAAGGLGFDLAALDERQRAVLDTADELEVMGGRARRRELRDALAEHPWLAALQAGGFSPPGADGVDRGVVRQLVQRGLVVERDGLWFAASAIDKAARLAARLLVDHPEGFTVSQLREAANVTRKHAVPLAAELDARGVTRRRDDLRIAGPRLPTP